MLPARDCLDRRSFLKLGLVAGTLRPVAADSREAKVAIVSCKSYGPPVEAAMSKAFDLLGGIGRLVKGKTITLKVNLTRSGRGFVRVQNRPPGETYITHGDTVMALCTVLFREGARRVRIVESFPDARPFEDGLTEAGWDVPNLLSLGRVELDNTRNLGVGKQYATVKVGSGGYLFSSFELNHSYVDNDVFISLSKLKNHKTTGVTMTMKNLFGITPNSLYGDQAVSEDGVAGRGRLHFGSRWQRINFPGQKEGSFSLDAGARIPQIIADLCEVRPVHLAIVDGITSISGGEGPWVGSLNLTHPGILLAGLNPVATDAVGTAIMGYDPAGGRGTAGFPRCENHLLLGQQRGLGPTDLSKIEIVGIPLDKARSPYPA